MDQLTLKNSKCGIGVFASKDFKKDECIIHFKGKIFDDDEIEYGSYEEKYCIQIGKRTFIGPSGELDDFINHSCNPNAGIKLTSNGLILIAIRKIKTGEEITWDYSTWTSESYWQMNCKCNSRNCRIRIGNFYTLPKNLREKYARLRVVGNFVKNDVSGSAACSSE